MTTINLRLARRALVALPLALGLQWAPAATTDLADVPLFTSSADTVKPNLMFILDDSGSMNSDYMPDEANLGAGKYGFRAAQCNGVAYNPATTYKPPVDAAGTPATDGSTTFISDNPNLRATSQRDLSTATITIVGSGSITVDFPASPTPAGGWYSNGNLVTVFSTTDTVKYMEGTVSSWNAGTRRLTIDVAAADGTGSTIGNLRVGNGGLPTYFTYSGGQPALAYTYTSSGVIKTTTFYRECNSNIGSTPGSAVFTAVRVSTASAQAQNYANWNTYYRTRMLMAKTTVSLAFKDIGDRYRVGYTTISKTNAAPDAKFLNINTFDATQKSSFYANLAAATPGGYTPLRGALSKAGRYFANKAPGQTADPVQYSCQQNFTILSTDGYWNTQAETATYAAFDLAGAAVGQQDGPPTDFPMRDGANALETTVSTWSTTRTNVTDTGTKVSIFTGASTTTTSSYDSGTGSRVDSYSGFFDNTAMTRCTALSGGACTFDVTTPTAHGLVTAPTASRVTIVNAAPAVYNNTYTVVAIVSSTRFRVRITGLSSRPSTPSNAGNTLAAGTCPAGQGQVTRSSVQTDTFGQTITSATTATQNDTTSYTRSEQVTVTPYTQTVIRTNGAVTSDTTAAGAPTVTNNVLTPPPNLVETSVYNSTPTTGAGAPVVVVTNLAPASVCSGTANNGTLVAPPVSPAPPTTTTTTPATVPTTVAVTTAGVSDVTVVGSVSSSTTSGSSGGFANSLADVAMYYYKNDLRTTGLSNCVGALGAGSDVCQTTDIDNQAINVKQNMQTFTLGLGVSGTLKYSKDYLSNPAGSDYFALTQGTKRWPDPSTTSEGPNNIDDLWHAAVNGGGQYFSARDPDSVVASLQEALRVINDKTGTSSAAATSTLQPVADDNDVFVAQFTSGAWYGDLKRFTINPTDGTISATALWNAATKLAETIAAGTARSLYYFKPGTGNTGALRSLTYSNLTADGLAGYLDGFCSKPGSGGSLAPAQCATFSAADLTSANSGTNLLAWLRGASDTRYRARVGPLGDVINSSPIFVGKPKFRYTENGYGAYVTAKQSRPGIVLVGANDGMLHAFDRATGVEKWAYMPTDVLPNLYKLADTDYRFNHQFFVDGAAQVGDVWDGSTWRTIVVGGMNKGGRMYYALDVTDTENPVALWEFRDPQLGLTYGNPVITKRKDGKWVVAFGSGYNNIGDGNGRLFVLDAITGEKLVTPVPTYTSGTTPAGTVATPSGLTKINAWIESDIDNTARVYYGGDLLGNVWRFDIDSNIAPFGQSFLLATLVEAGKPQPITTKLEVAQVNFGGSPYAVVYAGTGRYLGTTDLTNLDRQSVYALKDDFSTVGLGDVRAGGTLVTQTITDVTLAGGRAIRRSSTNAVDWSVKNGWLVDLPSSGERVNVNMVLAFNVLSVATNIPTTDVCDAGGRSWLYKFDIGTGSAVSNATDAAVAIPLGNVLVAGQTVVQLPDGRTVTISTLSDTTIRTDAQPTPPLTNLLRRTSWRELIN